MPFITYLFCEKCGPPANLDVDYLGTIEAYIADGRSRAVLDDRTLLWDYLIYGCTFCRKRYRYTFRDVERRVREYLVSVSAKQAALVDEVAETQVTEQARRSGKFFVEKEKRVRERLKKMYSR